MIRHLPIIALGIFFAACGAYPAGELIFVTNERDGTVSVIDGTTHRVVDTITTGGRPRGIRISSDGKRVYVAVSAPIDDQQAEGFDKIVVIDTADGTVIDSINVNTDPEQLAVDPGQRYIYVSNEDTGTATITDIATGEPVKSLITGIEPEGVTISPDGRWVYVMAETSNTVTVIDTQEQEVVKTFNVGVRPRDAAFSPDAKRAYVTSEVGQSMAVVDVPTHTVITTVTLNHREGYKPVGVVVSHDGRTIYVGGGRANCVSVIDAESLKILADVPAGNRVWGIGLSPDGRKLYASAGLSNDLTVIDTAALAPVKTIRLGQGSWGVAVRP